METAGLLLVPKVLVIGHWAATAALCVYGPFSIAGHTRVGHNRFGQRAAAFNVELPTAVYSIADLWWWWQASAYIVLQLSQAALMQPCSSAFHKA